MPKYVLYVRFRVNFYFAALSICNLRTAPARAKKVKENMFQLQNWTQVLQFPTETYMQASKYI